MGLRHVQLRGGVATGAPGPPGPPGEVSTATLTAALAGKSDTGHTHAPGDVTGTAVVTADARLSDARTPTSHTHPPSEITGTAVVTADTRLSDARTPTAHAHPISDVTALQTALDLKASLASPAFTGTPTGITKTHVGLGNVDNTTDTGKPVSTAQQTALDAKLDASQATAFGLSLLDDADAAAGRATLALGTLATQSGTFSGTSSGTNTGDQSAIPNASLATMAQKTYKGRTTASTGVPEDVAVATLKTDLVLVKADVGLGSVDNTSDAGKPVSTAQQAALDLKANLASPTFTGTVAGITKAMVGLTNANDTSDAAKPVSTATQTALDLKANALGADDNYATDAEKVKLANLSGTNSGDQTLPTDATIATTDITTNNASTSKHGWMMKFPGGTTNFLREDGTFAAPAGGPGGGAPLGLIVAAAMGLNLS